MKTDKTLKGIRKIIKEWNNMDFEPEDIDRETLKSAYVQLKNYQSLKKENEALHKDIDLIFKQYDKLKQQLKAEGVSDIMDEAHETKVKLAKLESAIEGLEVPTTNGILIKGIRDNTYICDKKIFDKEFKTIRVIIKQIEELKGRVK